MNERHAPEDLAFLREKGFTGTADEIERLHQELFEADTLIHILLMGTNTWPAGTSRNKAVEAHRRRCAERP